MKNPTITQYESDLKNLKALRTQLLKIKKLKKDLHTGSKTPLREVKEIEKVTFQINVTKIELKKLYAESKKINKDIKSAIKVSTQEKKRELDTKLKTKKSNLSVKK